MQTVLDNVEPVGCPVGRARLRVLLISHTCQSRSEGQPKAELLGGMPDIDLRVLVPDRWMHYGSWRTPDPPRTASYGHHVGKVAMPWMGPAQFYLHWYPGLTRLLRQFRPHVIDLWEEPWALVSAQACWLRNRLLPGTRVISETEQNIDKNLPPPFERFRSYTLRNANYAVGRSQEALEVVRRKGYSGPGEVVPNAVDADLFRRLDRRDCQDRLGLDGFLVGYIGRLVPEKGLLDLLQALALCPPEVRLVFVGSGPLEAELLARAERLKVESRVHLLGSRPAEELPRLINNFDVLALPSRTTSRWKEQFGRVIIEAHACGIPVIGSDSGAIPDVIGEAGIVFPEGDVGAISRAIRRLVDNPNEAASLGDVGHRRVHANYTWRSVAQQMHQIYWKSIAPGSALD